MVHGLIDDQLDGIAVWNNDDLNIIGNGNRRVGRWNGRWNVGPQERTGYTGNQDG